jgi:hypothetical protein
MRYELSDYEWVAIKPMLHSKTRPYLPDHSFKLQEVQQVQQNLAQPIFNGIDIDTRE